MSSWRHRDTEEHKRLYYRQLHANKVDSLGDMGKCSQKYTLPRLNWEETENMKTTQCSEIETVIKNIPTTKIFQIKQKSRTRWLHRNSIKYLDKRQHLSFWNCSKKLQKEHSQFPSMRPPSPWYQNWSKSTHTEIISQYHWWTCTQKLPKKCYQTNSNNTLKWTYTMITELHPRDGRHFSIPQISHCDTPC